MSSSERRAGAALLAIALGGVAACASAPIKQWDLIDQPLSCEEANRLAYRTVDAMGYAITGFEPAAPGTIGAIHGQRTASGETLAITVRIDCQPSGVTLIASRDGVLIEQMDTKRGFNNAFLNVRSMSAGAQQLDAQMQAGTAPASQQRRDLRVRIEPLRGPGSKLEFPFDLSAAGLLPVRVEVTNLTTQTYRVDADAVRLQRPDRSRVAPLSIADAAARIEAARIDGAPLSPLGFAALSDLLTARLFTGGELAPGNRREGFLYFPLAEYGSARMVVTDLASGEPEGVRVEF